MGAIELRQGQVLIGPLFSEPMRVETVTANGAGSWSLGLVGQSSEQFRRVTLTAEQLAVLTVRDLTPAYGGSFDHLVGAQQELTWTTQRQITLTSTRTRLQH
jgi:hypothetical protein